MAPMSEAENPHSGDPDREAVWEMLVARDVKAFVAQNWSMVEDDFIKEGFFGFSAAKSLDTDSWGIAYPSLDDYRLDWLKQAADTAANADMASLPESLLGLSSMQRIEITDNTAVAHKKFDGDVLMADGEKEHLQWQTLYVCRKVAGSWKIQGFVGYVPYPLVS